jgi:hypothetical protein
MRLPVDVNHNAPRRRAGFSSIRATTIDVSSDDIALAGIVLIPIVHGGTPHSRMAADLCLQISVLDAAMCRRRPNVPEGAWAAADFGPGDCARRHVGKRPFERVEHELH